MVIKEDVYLSSYKEFAGMVVDSDEFYLHCTLAGGDKPVIGDSCTGSVDGDRGEAYPLVRGGIRADEGDSGLTAERTCIGPLVIRDCTSFTS